MIAYRIQQPEHPTAWLLDPERQHSTNWADDEDVRDGVSACSTVEDLATYFAQVGIALSDDCLLVAMECDWADGEDMDAALGAILVIPSAIVSTEIAGDRFLDMVGDAYDRLAA